jgi:ADP-L-glycero-D-manno-heptose 6-epimerase
MILLTGAAGFIGSNIMRSLNDAGRDDVIVVDDLSDGTKCGNLADLQFADYIDAAELSQHVDDLPRLDGILHQGACVDTTAKDGRAVMETNFAFSKRLLSVAERQRCPFVYASSAAVYGRGKNGFREELACEDARTPYAFSKWAFDQYVRRFLPKAKTKIAGLRYFNVYGPREAHKGRMASVAWHAFAAVRRSERPAMFEGSERFLRDFIYIDDVARINLFFLGLDQKCGPPGGIYNVGTGNPRSFADLVAAVAKVSGGKSPMTIPFPEDLQGQYQEYTCADITRLRAAGWSQPFTSLEDGVERYWETIGA